MRVDQPLEPAQEPVRAAAAEHPGRHCWVSVPVGASSPRKRLASDGYTLVVATMLILIVLITEQFWYYWPTTA